MKNVELQSRDEGTNHLIEKQQSELGKILKDCKGVFFEPKGLPHMEVGQKIPIKVGVDPINVRPYLCL